MPYIVAGSNSMMGETADVSHQVDTAIAALAKITELEADGYSVKLVTAEGDEMTLDDLRAHVFSEQAA